MNHLTPAEMFLRLLAASVAGIIVGWERERHGRPAGLRTTMLACMGSALGMIISELLADRVLAGNPGIATRPDPGRLAAGVLTGIGFLGAGTIMRHSNMITGVTTAASLWTVTLLGLAFGSGFYVAGFIAMAFVLAALFVVPLFERHLVTESAFTFTLVTALPGPAEAELRKKIINDGARIRSTRATWDLARQEKTLSCDLTLRKKTAFEISRKWMEDFAATPGVLQVRLE